MVKKLGFLVFVGLLFQCQKQENQKVVSLEDIQPFLDYKKKEENQAVQFWENRLQQNPKDIVAMQQMAGLLAAKFRSAGTIEVLLHSDSLYQEVVERSAKPSASLYLGLAQNSITQHQFRQANLYLDSAEAIGDKPNSTRLLRYDVAMEIGDYALASSLLGQINPKDKFQLLLRKAKYQDYEGNLEGAIKSMEEALVWAEEKDNEDLILWARSNLADMYGHDGQIRKSYETNLKVLAQDSSYKYALKGIAWVAFANDRDTELAKKIIQNLHQKNPRPDYDLLLAEIASLEGDENTESKHIKSFKKEAARPEYGVMYNTYLLDIYAGKKNNLLKAKAIADQEIAERPTPASYSLLAWIYHIKGDLERAVEIMDNQVAGKTYEPDAQYKMGVIYKLDGQNEKAQKYLKEAQAAAYELGPETAAHVEKLLSQL